MRTPRSRRCDPLRLGWWWCWAGGEMQGVSRPPPGASHGKPRLRRTSMGPRGRDRRGGWVVRTPSTSPSSSRAPRVKSTDLAFLEQVFTLPKSDVRTERSSGARRASAPRRAPEYRRGLPGDLTRVDNDDGVVLEALGRHRVDDLDPPVGRAVERSQLSGIPLRSDDGDRPGHLLDQGIEASGPSPSVPPREPSTTSWPVSRTASGMSASGTSRRMIAAA